MSRKKWEAMPDFDRANFLTLGGTLFDDPPERKDLDTMTSRTGQTITRGEWDVMTNQQRVEFASGTAQT